MRAPASLPLLDPRALPATHTGRTHWSRVQRLSRDPRAKEDPAGRRGWEDAWLYLWETFRPAMLATVRRTLARAGGGVVAVEEAEDVLQSFLLACIEKDHLARADPASGRFRTFVAICLRRHTLKYVEHRGRRKRSPSAGGPVSLDEDRDAALEPVSHEGAWDQAFQEDWIRCLLEAALARVRTRSAPNADLLRLLLDDPALGHDALTLRVGATRAQVTLRLHRARRMLATEFWTVVKQTISDPRDLEDERARLGRMLARYLDANSAPSLFATA